MASAKRLNVSFAGYSASDLRGAGRKRYTRDDHERTRFKGAEVYIVDNQQPRLLMFEVDPSYCSPGTFAVSRPR